MKQIPGEKVGSIINAKASVKLTDQIAKELAAKDPNDPKKTIAALLEGEEKSDTKSSE